jgi:asparagine synthase (glutamine-hydrolysing)
MCGICGFLGPSGGDDIDRAAETVAAMATTLAHRGPDDAGVWVDATAGIALGHRRLSILDLSPEGHQPMVSACGRYVLCFNGEIYNHRELRRALGQGAPWRGHSDTEVLLQALVSWGIERTLASVNGMFAFALWSRDEGALYLARDRLGEKPLYYGSSGDHFLFASELKALRAHPAWESRIDRDALALFLRFGYVPAPHSIFRGIGKLPPGCWLRLEAGDAVPRVHAYWSARAVAAAGVANPFQGSETDAVDALEALLLDAVGRRMEADVPLGAFLSGGIDSSTVVALMQAQADRPVRTFSIGFREADFDEAVHARAVAAHLGCEHTELYVAPEAGLALLPELPRLWDEPFGDVSQIPTYLVSAMAREHVTVCLSGDGGDELFGGYNRYLWVDSTGRSIARLPRLVRRLGASLIHALGPEAWNRLLAPAARLLPGALRVQSPGYRLYKAALVLATDEPAAIYRSLVSHWQRPTDLVIGGVEPRTVLDEEDGSGLGDGLQTMMYLDAVTYLPDDILVKVDRASMGVGLEARVPLLDHRLFEFAWSLPRAWKVRDGVGKRPLRAVLQRHLPGALLDRPKMGFSVPLGAWLRGPLRDWAEALLDEGRLRREGFLAPEPVRSAWRDHLAGSRAGEYRLWNILMFQAWLDASPRQQQRP